MASKYPRAEILENGNIFLTPGRYFVDLETALYNTKLPPLSMLVPPQLGDEMILSGRGQVMASFTPHKDTVIHREIGVPFWKIPSGMTLAQVSDDLYGNYVKDGYGMFDYLAEHHPEVLQTAVEGAENYVEAIKEVAKIGNSTGKTVAIVAASVGILYIGMKLLSRK